MERETNRIHHDHPVSRWWVVEDQAGSIARESFVLLHPFRMGAEQFILIGNYRNGRVCDA